MVFAETEIMVHLLKTTPKVISMPRSDKRVELKIENGNGMNWRHNRKEKSEVQMASECYTNTTVNIATALGFFSRMCSLQSLEMLESDNHLVTALSVESWPGRCKPPRNTSEGGRLVLRRKWDFP